MKINLSNIDRGEVVKYSLVLILVVVVYFVIRKAIKKMKADAEALKLKDEIKTTELTYPLNQYVSMADTLDYAMNGAGTTDDIIRGVFEKMKNISDVLQLIQSFGVRAYSSGWSFGILTDDYNLTQFIQADLNKGEIQKINNILLSKGINFSF